VGRRCCVDVVEVEPTKRFAGLLGRWFGASGSIIFFRDDECDQLPRKRTVNVKLCR
jgi:hypothetical protein